MIEPTALLLLGQPAATDATTGVDVGRALTAAALALAATVALPLGAALAIFTRPPQRVVAAVMAFGAGALIEALALDLAFAGAEELIRGQGIPAPEAWAYVAAGFLAGGATFHAANRALEHRGGHLRHPSLTRRYLEVQRHRFADLLHALHADRLPDLVRHGTKHAARAEHAVLASHVAAQHGGSAPMAIFLGALLDGIPESLVIGARFTTLAAFNPGFLIAVFLNNLPEAMSSASGMRTAGFSTARIFALWTGLMLVSGVFGALGNLLLAGAAPTLTVFVNALAGGGILAMLATTMMPEAFEEGGPAVGLATIGGFLCAFLFFTLGLS